MSNENVNPKPEGKKVLKKFTDEQNHIATLCGFADDQEKMESVFGGEEMPPAEAPVEEVVPAEIPPMEELPPAEAPNPIKERINKIKDIISKEDIEKGIKSDAEKLMARLEEADKIITDADAFLKKNETVAMPPATETETPATA